MSQQKAGAAPLCSSKLSSPMCSCVKEVLPPALATALAAEPYCRTKLLLVIKERNSSGCQHSLQDEVTYLSQEKGLIKLFPLLHICAVHAIDLASSLER